MNDWQKNQAENPVRYSEINGAYTTFEWVELALNTM